MSISQTRQSRKICKQAGFSIFQISTPICLVNDFSVSTGGTLSAADVYTEEVHRELERYATRLPTDKVAVGDVGQLHGHVFVRIADLKDFGIAVNVVRDPNTKSTYKFMSSGTKEVAIDSSASGIPASAASASAKLNIAFSKEHSVYFSLAQCLGYAVDNLVDLGQKILQLVQRGKWQLDFYVVTRVVTAGSATILQAELIEMEVK